MGDVKALKEGNPNVYTYGYGPLH